MLSPPFFTISWKSNLVSCERTDSTAAPMNAWRSRVGIRTLKEGTGMIGSSRITSSARLKLYLWAPAILSTQAMVG